MDIYSQSWNSLGRLQVGKKVNERLQQSWQGELHFWNQQQRLRRANNPAPAPAGCVPHLSGSTSQGGHAPGSPIATAPILPYMHFMGLIKQFDQVDKLNWIFQISALCLAKIRKIDPLCLVHTERSWVISRSSHFLSLKLIAEVKR